jgi:copper homeostasis protein
MIFEVCVDSIIGAQAAERGGAGRVEVCDNLVEGGTTPSIGLLWALRKKLAIDINAMIRPRGGDFLYNQDELEVMIADISAAKEAGCDGVVFGLLTREGDIDMENTRRLVSLARPMSVTFHRAFDMARDPQQALEVLIDLKVDRLLTSGLQPNALTGAEMIRNLVQQAEDRIIIMAGAGVNETNLARIVTDTGVSEVHFSARVEKKSEMIFRNSSVFMGKAYQPDEYLQKVTDEDRVRAVIRSLDKNES